MPHKTFRAAAAATTFIVGLAVVWLSGLLPSLETRLADWLVPDSGVMVTPARLITREESDTEEVYATVVREMFGGDGPLVVISSEAGGDIQCGNNYETISAGIGAEAETVSDYCRSKPSKRLSKLPNVAAKQVLLDYEEYLKMFRGGDSGNWKYFYKKYPNSSGYITLSAVGFNRAGDEAMLDASKSCGWLCGEGWSILLRKGPDGWYIKKKLMSWVS